MGLPKRLTEMQKRFAELLVFGGPDGPMTKSEAAKQAGYSEKRCRQEGSELTNPKLNPLVAKYIGELKEVELMRLYLTQHPKIFEKENIKYLPTVVLYHNGKTIVRIESDISLKLPDNTLTEIQSHINKIVKQKF